jgi:threonine aldolase
MHIFQEDRMYSFSCDYSEGAHQRILSALFDTNMEQTEGYGLDRYSLLAQDAIKEKIGSGDVDIHFIPGGTQTNMIAISAFLKPHEAVVSARTGHIDVHEAGAIEATGHKILGVAAEDGKLRPETILPVIRLHSDEHMVKPRLIYISNSTELGTVYIKSELEALSAFCRENGLLLYIDGARLGNALCSPGCGLTLGDLARLTDAFYIGGTKNGALFGEALVICNDGLKSDFRYCIKQKGALLAKGRVMGLQFYELFRSGLFFELARHANETADVLRSAIASEGFSFLADSPSNQIFPILPDSIIEKLQEEYDFHVWSRVDESRSCIRLVTSWATPRRAAEAFAQTLKSLNAKG